MSTNIKCPKCGHEFALGEAEAEEYKKELQQKMTDYVKQKDAEYNRKAEEFDKQKLQIETAAGKKAADEMSVKLRSLEEESMQKTQQLKELQKKELLLLRERNELEERAKNLDTEIEKRILENRKKIEQETVQREQQMFDLKLKDKDLQLDGLKKTIEELKRKSEQGSMQIQGESQELLLEELLRTAFPFDLVSEVGKGVRGADCIQTVRNNLGQECGKIIFESKRTKDFAGDWIEKLKADMRSQGADAALLVTQAFPKDMNGMGEKDGVWICGFAEVKVVVQILRDGLIKLTTALKSQENKGDKMHILYNYLTSREFADQWQAIREGFMNMKISIQRERDAMEKLWKAREKQLEKVLLNAAHIRGSIEGISGTDVDFNLLENGVSEEE